MEKKEEINWKRFNKPPACTKDPLYNFIPAKDRQKILHKIRQDSIDELGYSLDKCPKRKVCLGKECMGRPLPTFSETAKPYIEELKKTQKVVNGELFIQGCDICPIAKTCSSPCMQVTDSVNRNESKEPMLIYKGSTDNYPVTDNTEFSPSPSFIDLGLEIPWDILPDRKKDVVKTYIYEERDFKYISDKLGMYDQANVKFEFYSALNKLSEYAVMRKFMEENEESLTNKQNLILYKVYQGNLTFTDAAKELDTSPQAVQAVVKRVINKHNIKWQTFVKRVNNKLVYNVPAMLK